MFANTLYREEKETRRNFRRGLESMSIKNVFTSQRNTTRDAVNSCTKMPSYDTFITRLVFSSFYFPAEQFDAKTPQDGIERLEFLSTNENLLILTTEH